MKKTIIFLLPIILLFSACSESFLDSEPITKQTAEGYFQTPKNALEGLTGCYNGLVLDEWTNLYSITTIASDEAFAGGGKGEGGKGTPYGWDEFKEGGARNQNADIWKHRYTSIYRCNSFMENLKTVDWSGSTDLTVQYTAEARFLRAFYYLDLVRFFGNIPLITSSIVVDTLQAKPAEVYAFIAKDLKYAIENLPSTTYSQIISTNFGHATKWAAEAMMARAFLFYTGRYSKTDLAGVITKDQALAYLEDVITSSGHDLIPEFKNLWPVSSVSGKGVYAGEDNKETVFSIKYTYGSGYSGLGNNRWLISTGLRWHSGTPAPYSWGWGQGTVSKKYWNNVYETGDNRKIATVMSVSEELKDSVTVVLTKDKDGIALTVDNTGAKFNFEQWTDYTGYFNKKYVPLTVSMIDVREYPVGLLSTNSAQYDQCQDWIIIRYADVLLMAAELGSANAQTYLDKVRDRAFGDALHRITVSTDNIRKERQREFALEGIRYWDLLRYGSAIAAQEINSTESVAEGGIWAPKAIVFDTEKDGLFQIPWDQIDLSEENGVKYLVQNPGW